MLDSIDKLLRSELRKLRLETFVRRKRQLLSFPARRLICILPMLAAVYCQAVEVSPDDKATVRAASENYAPLDLARLEPRTYLQELVTRNLEIQYSRLNADVTRHLREAEAGIYEPAFFSNARKEGRNRQQTLEEIRLNSANATFLDEKVNVYESGVRGKLPNGADISFSYKRTNKNNNLIYSNSFGVLDTEHSGLLNVNLKQPLLRNYGRAITETDSKIAALEHQASLQQLAQQAFKTSIEGLNLYWQLHRSQETVRLRSDALQTSKALFTDTESRIAAGRMPSSSLLELNGVQLNREAELVRGMQTLRESQNKLSSSLNVLRISGQTVATKSRLSAPEFAPEKKPAVLEDMLKVWAPYQIALVRQRQAQLRLDFARNQKLPGLDFVMSYGNTGLGYTSSDARSATRGGKYPDWYIGLNLEIPILGNQKAQEQFLAQKSRLEQAEVELQLSRNNFINDLQVRLDDVQNARTVLLLGNAEVKLRQSILESERTRVQLGAGLLGTVIQKQSDLIEAQQRSVENQVRYEIALATWQFTQGSLLLDNGIQITGLLPVSAP